ncbi:MAG: hypothetical protein HFG29_04815 [Eubacterium sp.]|nr:hypothetical protein [Eubacterium sp.]
MKNVIKKACAVVMVTAVLFTTVAPKPVLAACSHPRTPLTGVEERLDRIVTHRYGTNTCTIYVYITYSYSKCRDCNAILHKTIIKGREVHSSCGC